VAIALPWLEVMTPPRSARAATPPRRFLSFFEPNGYVRSAWVPTGTETSFTLNRSLKPLEPHLKDIVILDGLNNTAALPQPGDDHMRGMGSMLTGTQLLEGKMMGGSGRPAGFAAGISVDQELVNRLKPPTKLRSLELGVQSGRLGEVYGISSYGGPNQPLPVTNDPAAVFDRLFADGATGAGDPGAAERLRAERRSVLDAVKESYAAVLPRLSAEDRRKLDAHFTHLRSLETRFLDLSTGGGGCDRPARPALDHRANANFPAVGKLQMDLLVAALACDLTRVGSLQWSHSVGDVRFTWLGASRGHHDMSHDPDSNTATWELVTKIDTWYAEQFAYLLGRLKSIQEGDRTLLDNCLVVWCNELSRGNSHSHDNQPFVLAGRAGGALRTGRFLKYSRIPHNNLLVSLLNAMGVPATTFGNPANCTGALTGLL
jgi:hypothetical protein